MLLRHSPLPVATRGRGTHQVPTVHGEIGNEQSGGGCSHHRSEGDVDTFSPELSTHGSTASADEGPVEAMVLSENGMTIIALDIRGGRIDFAVCIHVRIRNK